MGCSWSIAEHSGDGDSTPNALQAGLPVHRPEWRRRQDEKHKRQIQKLQKRTARQKQRRERGSGSGRSGKGSGSGRSGTGSGRSGTGSGRSGMGGRLRLSVKSHPDQALQLRLLGGSNGSSATECVSALYARTLEQQREELQRTVEQRMLDQLDRELHTFLLNQLLLGIQFFSHFEAEMAAVDAELLARRQGAEHSLLQSGAIDAAVARNLLFKAASSKTAPQPLQKPVTYVVFENVDVARPHDANYDTVAALCKVLLETDYDSTTPCSSELVQLMKQTRWMGYVRLKLRDQSLFPSASSSSPLIISSDEECVYADAGYSSGDYDHVYLARLNTPRPLKELRLNRKQDLESNVLPESCVRRLASCLPPELEQTDDEDNSSSAYSASSASEGEQEDEREERRRNYPPAGYETVQVLRQCHVEQLQQCYLSSQQFMLYFGELLRQQLGHQLGISASQLDMGSYRGCSVYTAREELVPAIHVPHEWPSCAFRFGLRARPRLINLHTAEQFEWPTEQMRKRIRWLGYHVVPVGYAPKRSRNPFRELEWRIVFPQAEQYLERHCLTPMQLKVFQLMKLLVKTFVESTDAQPPGGVLLEQLRAHLFWQCEQHSNDWPEEFLGERLVRFIRSFDACLAKKHLSDYFIEERNLFEHVPEDTLMKLRSVMAGIAEQPLLHVVQALRNLQHKPDFYPQLDYKQMLRNLRSQDYLELHAWGKFSRPRQGFPSQEEQELKESRSRQSEQDMEKSKAATRRKTDITDAGGLLGLAQHQERSRGKLRRKTQLLKATNQMQLQLLSEAAERRSSLDSLDLHLILTRSNSEMSSPETPAKPQLNNGLEILRRSNLLELLLDHLLAMLTRAIGFGNRVHAQLYLEQGQRLCRLYQHLGCSQQAQHFVEELQLAASSMEAMDSGSSSRTPLLSGAGEGFPDEELVQATPSVRRKSVKFQDHVAQIHSSSSSHPIKLSGDLRGNPEDLDAIEIQGEVEVKLVENVKAESQDQDQGLENPTAEDATAPKVETTLFSVSGLIQRLNIDPVKIQTISSRTGQLVQKVAPSEAKREELKEILKSRTQMLKEAFN